MYSRKFSLFNQRKLNEICSCKYHLNTFTSQKFSRNFINSLIKYFSNKNGIGLYTYAVLLSGSITNTKYNKNKEMINFPYYNCSDKSTFEKYDKSYFETFENLCMLDLIKPFDYKKGVYIYMLNRLSNQSFNSKEIKSEFAAVKSNSGYFFIEKWEINKIIENMGRKKFSECDAIIDLLMNTVYNDDNIWLSEGCPIVCFDSMGIECNITIRELSKRWNISIGSVHKLLKKLQKHNLFNYFALPNKGIYITSPVYAKSIWNIETINDSVWDFYKDAYGHNGFIYYEKMVRKKVCAFLKNKKDFISKLLKNKNVSFFIFVRKIINKAKYLRSFFANINEFFLYPNSLYLSYFKPFLQARENDNYRTATDVIINNIVSS